MDEITRENIPETVITCAKSIGGKQSFGYIVYGNMIGIDEDERAHMVFHFRDDWIEVVLPLDQVRTTEQGCHTCIHRLSKLTNNCNGEYQGCKPHIRDLKGTKGPHYGGV